MTKEGSRLAAFFGLEAHDYLSYLYSNEIHRISFYNKRITFWVAEAIDLEIDI